MRYRLGRFDLTTEAFEIVHVEEAVYRDFVGGAGIAAALLFPTLTQELDPLAPESPLLLATGPLTGTRGPSVGRFVICGKSPATNLWAESNIGGSVGPELRAAGLEGLWITGRAENPVFLSVSERGVRMHNASHLWGVMDTYETQTAVKSELEAQTAKVLTIGLAGENQVPFALILSDHGRVAGRTGMGAVMGSKNLKAIAVHGAQTLPYHDYEEFSSLRSRINRELKNDLVSVGLRDFGTASGSDLFDYFGMMPKHYFSRGSLDKTDQVSGMTLKETLLSGVSTCHGCVIACGRKVRLKEGREQKGPEYETTMGFGPNLGITDLEMITRLGDRCDRLGMDTISFSNILGMLYFLFVNDLIDADDTQGHHFTWGDAGSVMTMMEETAQRQGLGAMIALGAKQFAEAFGVAEFALEVKGLEIPYHDPRGASGVGLVYATSPRGACHNQSHYYLVEIGQTMESIGIQLLPRKGTEGKPANVARHQDWTSVLNSLVLCILANVPPEDTIGLLNHATGWDYDIESLLLSGERIWTLKRIINSRLGASPADDYLPAQLMQPLEDGGAAGYIPPIAEMLDTYYSVRGWDPLSGLPDAANARRLGLEEYLPDSQNA